jgi:hypothetical protein
MSGKRAKPSPWRFLRAAPVVVVAVVVWVLVGFFLLMPGSGTDQAHDWGVGPIPSSSDDERTRDGDSLPAGSTERPTPDTAAPRPTTAGPQAAPSSRQAPAADLALSGASTSPGPARKPAPRPTSDPTSPVPTPPASGHGPGDNPGKAKGHRKPHGPPSDRP